jgi:signal transduction histidine kinase
MKSSSFPGCGHFLLAAVLICKLFAEAHGQTVDSLQNELARSKPDTHQVTLLYQIAYAQWLGGEDSLAYVNALRSVILAQKTRFIKGETKARLFAARIDVDRLDGTDQGLAQVDTVLTIAEKTKDMHLQAEAYIRRAQLLETHINRQKEIPVLFKKALGIFKSLGDLSWQGTVYNEQAQMMMRNGKADEGIKLFLEARKLQEQTRDVKALRSTLPNLGVAYSSLSMYNEALRAFADAEKLPSTKNDKILNAFLLRQRAEILEKQGNYPAALAALADVARIHEASGGGYWLPKTYAKMARVYFALNDQKNALKYNQLADKLTREASGNEEFLDQIVQINYGKIYLKQKSYDQVIAYASKGLEWAAESDPVLLMEMAEYNRQLTEAYKAKGNYKLALEHYQSYKTQSDSLVSNAAVQKATAMALQFDFDKKDQLNKLNIERLENDKLMLGRNAFMFLSGLILVIAGVVFWSNKKLKGKNAELKSKNHEITQALQKGKHIERKRVASELHDNLATKLAALRWRMEAMDVSVLRTQDQKIHAGSLQMLEDIYGDVRLISHDMLAAELKTSGLQMALQKLADQLNSNPRIRFDLDISTTSRPDERVEFEIYQVVLELVNNIIKHSQATKVEMHLTQHDGALMLAVRDNGVGFDVKNSSEGIGLKSIASRIESLGGKWKVDSSPSAGTTLTAQVPLV